MENRNQIENKIKARLELWRRKARDGDFLSFCYYWDVNFFSKRPILKEIMSAYQFVHDSYSNGKSVRVAISAPPRFGKSYISSLFCAFMLGRFPQGSIMRNTSTALLYRTLSKGVGDFLDSDKWRKCFENNIYIKVNNAEKIILDSAKVLSYFGNGVGGNIIGNGASIIAMTDDLFSNMDDALSGIYNDRVVSWDESAMRSRVEGNCCRIDVGTRWTKNDVIGRNISKYDKVVKITAINENGESNCPDVHSTEFYKKEKQEIDKMVWDAEYMQEPIDVKGQLFCADDLMYYEKEPKEFEANLAICDTADTGIDNLSSPMVKKVGEKYYLYDVVFTQLEMELTEPMLVGAYSQNRVDIARFESNNGGKLFAKNVQKGVPNTHIYWKPTTSNKETRILTDSFWIKKHIVFRKPYDEELNPTGYKFDSDYSQFMRQVTSYIKGVKDQHDDAPDSLSMLRRLIQEIYETHEQIPQEDEWGSYEIDACQIRLN